MRHIIISFAITAAMLSATMTIHAAQASHRDRSSLPINIKSNQLSADNKNKTAVFSGKVVAKQGDVTIYADKVTINYGEKKGDVDNIIAEGTVRIVQENRTGVATHAVYDSREGRITLTGSPRVMQGDDSISGDTITYYIDEERSVVTGGSSHRVEAVIQPPPKKSNAPKR